MIVVGEAGTGTEAIEVIERHQPDVVVLDLSMPEMDGLEAIPLIHSVAPSDRDRRLLGVRGGPRRGGRAPAQGEPVRPQGRGARGPARRREGSGPPRRLNFTSPSARAATIAGVESSTGNPEVPPRSRPPYYPPTYVPEPEQPRPWWKGGLGVAGAVGLLLLKFGAKAKALLLLLPKLKLFTTSATMLVSVGAYALIWGWKFAVGFVLLLFVHEMGHVWQARREGLPASAPFFIPFLGAAIALKELPKDGAAEARVGLAGPVLGTLGCCVPLAIWLAGGDEFWQALAFVGFFLNLFNLLPVLPLDGGRAMAALSPWMWLVGYALLIAVTIIVPEPGSDPGAAPRRLRDLAPLAGAQRAGTAALPFGRAANAGRGRGHLHRPSRGPRGRDGRHLPRAGFRRRVRGRAAPRGAPGCSRRTARPARRRPPARPRPRRAR